MARHFPKGLDGRQRDESGRIREKNGATRVATIRKEYGQDVAQGWRSDAKLDNVLKAEKLPSLRQLIKSKKGK